MVPRDKSPEESVDEPEQGMISCQHCGMKADPSGKYCPRCGWLLKSPEVEPGPPRNIKKSLLLLGRDVGVAVLIVLIVLGGIYAYTRVWPPMVVVESRSMQHSDSTSYIGVIDTGDLVLVQAAPQRSDVTTWVEGKASGYATYGNHGDVLIYSKEGDPTPIIHRAMFWLDYDATNNSFDIPDLTRLPLNILWGGSYANGSAVKSPYGLDGTLWLAHSGWRGDLNITFWLNRDFLANAKTRHDGYVMLGDNNANIYDKTLVLQEDVVGVARGELPWFGLLKLTIAPSPGSCCSHWGDTNLVTGAPKNSWDSLLIALILIIVSPILIDLSTTLLAKGKKSDEEEAEDEKEPDSSSGRNEEHVDRKVKGEPPDEDKQEDGGNMAGDGG